MKPRWRWQHAALIGLVVLTGLGATSLAARAVVAPIAGPPSLLGLRLGATPDMVRARFAGTSFRNEVASDVAMIATAPIEGVGPGARFEFHDGQLVAVRARLEAGHPDAAGDRLVASPGTVLSRSDGADGSTDALLLSRTCPTHHEEAERLLGSPQDPP